MGDHADDPGDAADEAGDEGEPRPGGLFVVRQVRLDVQADDDCEAESDWDHQSDYWVTLGGEEDWTRHREQQDQQDERAGRW